MHIIASVLAQSAQCNQYVHWMRSLSSDEEAISRTNTVYEFSLVRELASVLLNKMNANHEEMNELWDHESVIAPLKTTASTDRITLGTLCLLISSDSTELRAWGCLGNDLEENKAMKLFFNRQLWNIIYEILSSNLDYFLAGIHSVVLVKMCKSNREFLHQLETKLVTEAEDLLRKYMSSQGNDVSSEYLSDTDFLVPVLGFIM
jgi:hypothetical protein